MPSFLTAVQTMKHVTALPQDADPAKGIELFHAHVPFIKFGAHLVTYEPLDTSSDPAPELPPDRGLTVVAPPKSYKVTDRIQALPAGLWDSDVVSTYEFTNVQKGVYMRIRSPLNTLLETVWTIEARSDGQGHELIEEVVISCSRLLMSTIKGGCEAQWTRTHGLIIDAMRQGS